MAPDLLRRVTRALVVCGLALGLLALPAAAQAAGTISGFTGGGTASTLGTAAATGPSLTAADPNALTSPPQANIAPAGHRLTADQVQAIADKLPRVISTRKKYKGSYPNVFLKGTDRWQVSYFSRDTPPKEVAQVLIQDATGQVLELWTGPQVAWTMARGYPGAFGRKINEPIVWLPLMLLFVIPFIDPRRPFRLRHLDLLVLSAFSLSLFFFNRGEISTSAPMVYPIMLYLLGRMLYVGLKRRETPADREPLKLLVPPVFLIVGIIFLLAFRIGLNVVDSNVIDVGYSGVIGADRLVHGQQLYGNWPSDNSHGDTYGPAAYAAYVPFERIWPYSGRWDDLPAAHGAAILFDLLCVFLLFLVGRRVRGPTLGIALAYAWAAFPFTLYALNTNSNDALVPAVLLAAFLAASSAPARGALAGLAGMVKFAPLALAPLFATYDPSGRTRVRKVLLFSLGFAVVCAICLWPVLAHTTLREMYERTIVYQADRNAPFSIWGQYDLGPLMSVVQGLAVLLAVGLAFVPRRRDLVGLAALCAAVLIALQLGISYWFYLYIPWFFPLVMLALLGRHRDPHGPPAAPAAPEPGAQTWLDATPVPPVVAHPS